MADLGPIQAPVFGTLPTPVEDIQQSGASAFLNDLGTTATYGTLGAHAVDLAGASLRFGNDPRNQIIPHDQAVKLFQSQGLDPSIIPQEGWNTAAIAGEVNRQTKLQEADIQAKRANLGSASRFVSGLLGGATDPINIALGPVAGRVLGAAKLSLGARLTAGAVEGATGVGVYEAGQKHFEGHDADIASWSTVRDMAFGAVVGGGLHGMLGERPPAPGDIQGHLAMIRFAENTAGYAKRFGLAPEDVVSPKGAIGIYQIEPDTARQYGWDASRLKDPDYAQHVAEDIMTHLDKKFGGDRDAIAIAWNAGPGTAEKWIKAGRDFSVLPRETRAYLARIYQQGGREVFGKAPIPEPRAAFGNRLPEFAETNEPQFKFEHFLPVQREMEFHAPAEIQGTSASVLPEYQTEMRFEAQPELMRRPLPETEQPELDEQGHSLESAVKLESQRGLESGDQASLLERNLNRLKLAAAQLREDSPVDIGALDNQMAFEFLHKLWPGAQGELSLPGRARQFADVFERMKQGEGEGEAELEQQSRQRNLDLQEPEKGSPDWAKAKQAELWKDMAFRGSQGSLFDAIPKQGRMFSEPTPEQLAAHPFGVEPVKPKVAVAGEAPKATEAKGYMDETLEHAKGLLGAEKFNDVMKETEAEREEGLKHNELTKAVQAAVNCGVLKGLDYGAD